jgi:hypothetical protein
LTRIRIHNILSGIKLLIRGVYPGSEDHFLPDPIKKRYAKLNLLQYLRFQEQVLIVAWFHKDKDSEDNVGKSNPKSLPNPRSGKKFIPNPHPGSKGKKASDSGSATLDPDSSPAPDPISMLG